MNLREKIRELRRKRAALIQQARALLDAADAEERQMTPEEVNAYEDFQGQIDGLAADIGRLERQLQLEDETQLSQAATQRQDPQNEEDPSIGMSPEDLRRYSLVRALRAAAAGDWRGAEFEREVSEAVAQRLNRDPQSFFVPYDWMNASGRDLVVGTPTAGGNLVATDLLSQSFIEMLRNKMIVRTAGARVLSGLVGDIAIPRQTGGGTAYWVAESGAPTESQQAVDQVALSPKTVGAFTDISRKLLKQSSIDVELFVREDLATTLALAIDLACLHGTGASNQPTGIENVSGIGAVVGGANGAAPDWADIVDLETEVSVDNADVGTLAYITNPKVRGKLKQTEKASGTAQFVWERGNTPLNGYPAFVTNQVASDLDKGTSVGVCSAIFYGNWADLIIGMWGALDILVDPYTGGTSGTVRVIELQDIDIAVRHAESFAAMLDALTA